MDKLVGIDGHERQDDATIGAKSEGTEDVEDLVGEEAKLGIRKPARPRGATKVGVTLRTRLVLKSVLP
jgi:hypothetical protein